MHSRDLACMRRSADRDGLDAREYDTAMTLCRPSLTC